MEKLEGQVLWQLLYQVAPAESDALLEHLGRLITWLHRLDWRSFTDQAARYTANPAAVLADGIAWMLPLHAMFNVAGFLPVVNWLEMHQAEITGLPAIVHLDFPANNLFRCTDGRLAVID